MYLSLPGATCYCHLAYRRYQRHQPTPHRFGRNVTVRPDLYSRWGYIAHVRIEPECDVIGWGDIKEYEHDIRLMNNEKTTTEKQTESITSVHSKTTIQDRGLC